MNKISNVISPIAIDMGAKNTGVYLNHFSDGMGFSDNLNNSQGLTITIDNKAITWSQANRLAKRHQVRNNKRRKLAKRLLKLVLNKYGLNPGRAQSEYLSGLLNRRGYNRIEITEEQEEILESQLVNDFFSPIIFNNTNKASIFDRLLKELNIKDDEDEIKWKNVLKHEIFSTSGKEILENHVKNLGEDEDEEKEAKAELSTALNAIKNTIGKQLDNYKTGHLHRKSYLENIKQDIKGLVLRPLLNNDLTADKLACLIGNISNLQLRVLRKYFNDEAMRRGDLWKPEKLHLVFFKAIKSWHAKLQNEKGNRAYILKLKGNKDILDIFTTLDPEKTIPPYEDQNNRNPPKDSTLRLNPSALDEQFLNWKDITASLATNYILPQIDDRIIERIKIQEGLAANVSPQKIKTKAQNTEERQILADTLHRILDRTIVLDPYKLRWLAQGSTSHGARAGKELLSQHSNVPADAIVRFAKKYYAEVEAAKQGLWTQAGSLFFRCNTNPPHKSNLTNKLVGHILREEFDDKKIKEFRQKCWEVKIGRSTIKSIAGKIEATRKKHGNGFNYIVQTIKQTQKASWAQYVKDHEDVVETLKNTSIVVKAINGFLGSANQAKYDNPYSIAQLYNHLDGDITGFSKTDKFNTEENAWRDKAQSVQILSEGQTVEVTRSNAVRLTADSVRPFDGLLDRIISRQAIEIARAKIAQLDSLNIDKNDTFFVPVLVEENSFKSTQDLHDIKGSKNVKKKTKDKAQKGLKEQEKELKDKNSRIKKNTLCPYTGQKIVRGEVDHIIPQSASLKSQDVVFNSEANLIYCSSEGNHSKSNNRYTFEKLDRSYLNEVFAGEADVKQNIIDFVNGLDKKGFISFQDLNDKEQNYLRHALFIKELDSYTFSMLNTRYKTLVNGTQGYLCKQVRKLLQAQYPNVHVETYRIPYAQVSELRDTLSAHDDTFKKQEKQGAFSHVVDATLVLAAALQTPKIAKKLTTISLDELMSKTEGGKWLKDLLPKNASVKHIKRIPKYLKKSLASTQIFAESLYSEQFMRVLLKNKKLYYGFSLKNRHEIAPLKQPKKTVKDFDKELQVAKQEQQVKHNEYFELLKPFLYSGKYNAKKPATGDLCDQVQYQYLSVDTTKALTHLQKCAKEVCSKIEIEQAHQLEKLRYMVKKEEIKSVLLEGTGKLTFIKQLDLEKLTVAKLTLPAKNEWDALIKYPIKDYLDRETTLEACFGEPEQIEISNPALRSFWHNLAVQSGLEVDYLMDSLLKKNEKGELSKKPGVIPKTVFNIKIKTTDKQLKVLEDSPLLNKSFGADFRIMTDLIPQSSWDELFEAFFHTKKTENDSCHKQVRKVYSLPIILTPSGRFRIKRINPLTGEIVYQVSGINGGFACGFEKDEKGNINMTKTGVTFHPGLKESPNVAYVGKGGEPNIEKQSSGNTTEPFGSTRKVELKVSAIKSSYLTLAEAGRIDIRILVEKQLFETLCKFNNIDASNPPSNISIAFNKKTEIEKHDKFKQFINGQQIPMPKYSGKNRWGYNFSVQVLNQDIELSYRMRLSSQMKDAYQAGTLPKQEDK